nr:hypothetical protein [Escherichia coli]
MSAYTTTAVRWQPVSELLCCGERLHVIRMSASGGATITAKGAALHAGGMNGGPRLWWIPMVSEVCRLTVPGLHQPVGIGVVTDVSSYYRTPPQWT